jgi:Protein of unknown function (DUF2835)
MAVNEARFHLHISAEDYLSYYQGAAKYVMVTTHGGSSIQFSAHLLRPFVGHDGVHGEFVLRYDQGHKFVGLEKVGA